MLAGLEEEETVPMAQANSKAPSNAAETGWSPPSRRQSQPPSAQRNHCQQVTATHGWSWQRAKLCKLCNDHFAKSGSEELSEKHIINTSKTSLQGRKNCNLSQNSGGAAMHPYTVQTYTRKQRLVREARVWLHVSFHAAPPEGDGYFAYFRTLTEEVVTKRDRLQAFSC